MTGQRTRSGIAHTPVRMCVGCRTRAQARDLLRTVAMDGYLVVDERRRHPGRGAWLHPDARCLAMAERRRAFARALRVSGVLDAASVRNRFEQLSQEHNRYGNAVSASEEGSRSTRHESAVKLKP